jgi:hypothetical protein
VRAGELVPGPGLDLIDAGDAVSDRYKVVWVKGEDLIWRSRERIPASASTSRLLRLQVGPFRFCGSTGGSGDTASDSRTHTGHDDNTGTSRGPRL